MSALPPLDSPSRTDFHPSYVGRRPDIQRLVPEGVTSVLDVGCATGSLGSALKEATQVSVVGIELSPKMAAVARTRLDDVLVGDASELLVSSEILRSRHFDAIIFADLLEHLVDPWTVLRNATRYLSPTGVVIASIPNIRHISTLFALAIRGVWPYRLRGIHDRTHLRFFTYKNIIALFSHAGLTIDQIEAHYRLLERPHFLNRFAPLVSHGGLRPFLAFQYLVRASKQTPAHDSNPPSA